MKKKPVSKTTARLRNETRLRVVWTSLNFKWNSTSFRVTHYVILNVTSCVFYELNSGKMTFFLISFVKRRQNDVQYDVMRGAKWSQVSLIVKWRRKSTRRNFSANWLLSKTNYRNGKSWCDCHKLKKILFNFPTFCCHAKRAGPVSNLLRILWLPYDILTTGNEFMTTSRYSYDSADLQRITV